MFFDFYHPAKRYELWETGASAPAFVFTSARVPRLRRPGPVTLDLPKGTVWIRGTLIGAGLPAGAYVGMTIGGGTARLAKPVNVTAASGEVAAPLAATLTLKLAADRVSATEGGCRSGAGVELPELTLTFGPAGVKIEGGAGKAKAWRQAFDFAKPTGALDFIAPLWTLLIGYEVQPDHFDASAMRSACAPCRPAGTGLTTVSTGLTPGWASVPRAR
ncbi:MAG: hypothetical protein RQ750_09520 [Roseovarius sp.]|nr:hypothetical protein [Roseovarius sp.]